MTQVEPDEQGITDNGDGSLTSTNPDGSVSTSTIVCSVPMGVGGVITVNRCAMAFGTWLMSS